MAEAGIDRKAEERMEFTTSKEVEIGKAEPVHPRDEDDPLTSRVDISVPGHNANPSQLQPSSPCR